MAIKIPRKHLADFFSNIHNVCEIRLLTKTKSKIGKTSQFNELWQVADVKVKINFHKDSEITSRLKELGWDANGQKWQKNIKNTPLAKHPDTGKLYLRVMPVNGEKKIVTYCDENGN